MKSIRTLVFIFSVILLLGVAWYFFPAEGLAIGKHSLRFPSYAEDIAPAQEEVDVDAVMDKVNKSFEMTCSDNLLDSMRFFRYYLKENPNCPMMTILSSTLYSVNWNMPTMRTKSTASCITVTLKLRWIVFLRY